MSDLYRASMVERATGQRRAARVPVHDFDAPALPPWSDTAALLAELAWLRSWTRHLEQQNERLRQHHGSLFKSPTSPRS